MSAPRTVAAPGSEAAWHDVECGSYAADLALWSELARAAAGPVLELGCGTGRVALALAAEGHQVAGLDRSGELIAELERRAAARDLDLEAIAGDARDRELLAGAGERLLVLAPMQLVHLLGGVEGRRRMLAAVKATLAPGGTFAAALLEARPAPAVAGDPPLLPDVLELDGWVHSSQPLEVALVADRLEVRRLRQLVSPAGELTERVDVVGLDPVTPAEFEAEAKAAGFASRERLRIPATADHVGSAVCVLEVPR